MSLYDKPSLTFEEQADLLLKRGLETDRDVLISVLQVTSYYRITGYLYPFRQRDDTYKAGTTLDLILRLYAFDRQLKLLLLDAIECIEVHIRTRLAYHFAHKYGPFAYFHPANFPGFRRDQDTKKDDFVRWESKLKEQTTRNKDSKLGEDFVLHFFDKYGDRHDDLPIWMMIELMDFGSTLSFFRGVDLSIQRNLAATIKQPENVMLSWLLALNTVRNRCAHHASQWSKRMVDLFDRFTEVNPYLMGMPSDWRKNVLWMA